MFTKASSKMLLSFVWRHSVHEGTMFKTDDGTTIRVISGGRLCDGMDAVFCDAEIVVDDCHMKGNIVINDTADDWFDTYSASNTGTPTSTNVASQNTILHVVGNNNIQVKTLDGRVIPTISLRYPKKLAQSYIDMRSGGCTRGMSRMIPIEFTDFMTRLYFERLERKVSDVKRVLESVDNNWNQTFYIYMFRYIATAQNQNPLMILARAVPLSIINIERNNPLSIESLILGVGGYLSSEATDDHTVQLRDHFRDLQQKYKNDVININDWTSCNLRPSNLPINCMVQIIHLLKENKLTLANLLKCSDVKQVRDLFQIKLDPYWQTHFALGRQNNSTSNSIGDMKVNVMLINFIIPLLVTYAKDTGQEELQDSALDIINSIPFELNLITKEWVRKGVTPENAFYSQALIQLHKEYCQQNKCTLCQIGVRELSNLLND